MNCHLAGRAFSYGAYMATLRIQFQIDNSCNKYFLREVNEALTSDPSKTVRRQRFLNLCLYMFTLSSELEQSEIAQCRRVSISLLEKLFLHEKSYIRISLNRRNELNKEITLVYPYFSV